MESGVTPPMQLHILLKIPVQFPVQLDICFQNVTYRYVTRPM